MHHCWAVGECRLFGATIPYFLSLSPVFSNSCALFCTCENHNSFLFMGLRTLRPKKNRGGVPSGVPPRGTPTVSTLTPARITKSGPKPGAASHRPAPTLSALRITSHQSLCTLSCNQQVLREGPFAVDPLAIAAESRARGHLWNFFGSVLVRAFRPNRFVFL